MFIFVFTLLDSMATLRRHVRKNEIRHGTYRLFPPEVRLQKLVQLATPDIWECRYSSTDSYTQHYIDMNEQVHALVGIFPKTHDETPSADKTE
jgi:hypothetical protein